MKLLVITAGLNPTPGASNSYQEALMAALSRRGHDVVCVCTAATAPRPGVRTAALTGHPAGYRIVNGGVYPALYPQGGVGTQRPDVDEWSPRAIRRALLEIVRTERPDVISLQSFFGVPFSLVAELKSLGPRLVFTAHDYFPLCPTAHLFTVDGRACLLPRDELICEKCCAAAPRYSVFWLTTQLERWVERIPGAGTRRWLQRVRNGLRRVDRTVSRLAARAEPYRRRHDSAALALKQLDVVHCISRIQAAQMQRSAGTLPNLRILPLMPPTLSPSASAPSPRPAPAAGRPLTFVTLNTHSVYKGSDLIERVFRRLAETHTGYELHVYGNVAPGPAIPRVSYHGRYRSTDLDAIAAAADFCLVPSIWHETLGFVGMEMMARGVPLIVSDRAGVGEFVVPDETGFVFPPEPDDELHALLARLIAQPGLAAATALNLARRGAGLKSFEAHVADMEALFQGTPHP